jgi:hypothetical protein
MKRTTTCATCGKVLIVGGQTRPDSNCWNCHTQKRKANAKGTKPYQKKPKRQRQALVLTGETSWWVQASREDFRARLAASRLGQEGGRR